jgi:hypothetical protein
VAKRFEYARDRRYALICRLFLFRPRRDGVDLTDDGRFRATYGLFSVDTPLENISGAHVTRDYRWWTPFGVRLSNRDSGITFGTTSRSGACIHFAEPVRSALNRRRGHEALTVTVSDPDSLVAALGFAPE